MFCNEKPRIQTTNLGVASSNLARCAIPCIWLDVEIERLRRGLS